MPTGRGYSPNVAVDKWDLGRAPCGLEFAQAFLVRVRAAEVVPPIAVGAAPLHGSPVDQEICPQLPVRFIGSAVLVDEVVIPGQEQCRGDGLGANPGHDNEA